MTVNKSGTIAVDGPVSLSPLTTTLKVKTNGIDILPFRPYFADKLKIALTKGAVSAEGNLSLQSDRENNLKATYIGQAVVTKFTTIDKATSEDFLKWKSLHVTGVDVSTSPFRVDINEVTLADFYSRLTINPDTTLNVQGLLVDQPPAAQTAKVQPPASSSISPPQTAGESTPIKIAKMILQGRDSGFQ